MIYGLCSLRRLAVGVWWGIAFHISVVILVGRSSVTHAVVGATRRIEFIILVELVVMDFVLGFHVMVFCLNFGCGDYCDASIGCCLSGRHFECLLIRFAAMGGEGDR